ncbi:hypothetical protein [Acidithiobacillus sp.]
MSDYWIALLSTIAVTNIIGGALIWYLKREQKKRHRSHGHEQS